MIYFVVFALILGSVSARSLSLEVTASPPTQALCNDTTDWAVIHKLGPAGLHTWLRDCAVACQFAKDPVSCGYAKIVAEGFTDGCAECFTYDTKCTSDNCKASCLVSPNSKSCYTCLDKYCTATFWACAGIDVPRPPY